MSPHETFFLLPTGQIETELVNNNDNIEFSVVDFPGSHVIKHDSIQHIQSCGALIYVIDAHNPDTETACKTLNEVIKTTSKIKSDIVYEVLIHKVDSDVLISDSHKIAFLNDIQANMREKLAEYRQPISLAFQLTSIYDHTIYEALSKVV